MKKLVSLIKYDMKLLFRDLNSVLFSFLMPIGFYILFSNMLQGMPTDGNPIQELLIPLYTIIIIGNAVLNLFGVLFSQAQESGNLTKYKFLGINELLFSVALYAATVIFQIVVVGSFLIFTRIYRGIEFPVAQIGSIVFVLALINLYQFAISYMLNAIISRSALYNSVALTFYMFQMFLGGLTFPLEMFPKFLRRIVYIVNPIIYGRNALVDVWANKVGIVGTLGNILILTAISVGLLVVGKILNQRKEKGKTVSPLKVPTAAR